MMAQLPAHCISTRFAFQVESRKGELPVRHGVCRSWGELRRKKGGSVCSSGVHEASRMEGSESSVQDGSVAAVPFDAGGMEGEVRCERSVVVRIA
jgi:hypothetical protein